MSRYVILLHEMPSGHERPTHYDVLLESGDVLRAWAIDDAHQLAAGAEVAATPLADHRPTYLDYEGEVSGARGRVTRWDAGTFDLVRDDAEALVARLNGARLTGLLQINHGISTEQTPWAMMKIQLVSPLRG